MMSQNDPSKIDQLLDLLLDALQERQDARNGGDAPVASTPEPVSVVDEISVEAEAGLTPESVIDPDQGMLADSAIADMSGLVEEQRLPIAAEADLLVEPEPPFIPEKLPSINLDRMLGRLAIFIMALIVVVNVPFNRFGTNLARAMPDEQALVIRDGLVIQGDGDEIYVLENNQKRWISSITAFEYYGYRWEQVNQVDDAFLAQFPDGPALSILFKCSSSPHVYAIENGQKRWIKDIPTFQDQGYVWEDVQIVGCGRLDNMPSGPPIPPDAGEPPE